MADRKLSPKTEKFHSYLQNHDADLRGVAELLKPGVAINSFGKEGHTPLHHAVKNPNSDPKVVEFLLENGADVLAYNMQDQCNALHYATRNPNVNFEVIETLLKYGANINAKNYKNHSNALIYATQNPDMTNEVLELLLKHGANPSTRSYIDCWYTPLHYAIRNPNFDEKSVEILLEYGANIHCDCAFGDTPLHSALVNDSVKFDIVKALLRRESKYYHCLRKALDSYSSSANSRMGCLEVLKHIVVEQVIKNPRVINDFYTCKSVLGGEYFDLISGHSQRNLFSAHVTQCVEEITRMKRDYIFERCPVYEIICSGSSNDMPLRDGTERHIERLLSIWCGDSSYPIYSDVIKSNIRKVDVLNTLTNFRISGSSFEGAKRIFLDNASTLLIVKGLNLNDLMSLIEAFYDVNKVPTFLQCNLFMKERFKRRKFY